MDAISRVVEEAAIRNLSATFMDAVNRNDSPLMATLFADDAEWVIGAPMNMAMTGAANIMEMFNGLMSQWKFFNQLVLPGPVVLSHDAQTATAHNFVHENGIRTDGNTMRVWGYYEDEFVRLAGGWKFKSRRFTFQYMDSPNYDYQYIAQ